MPKSLDSNKVGFSMLHQNTVPNCAVVSGRNQARFLAWLSLDGILTHGMLNYIYTTKDGGQQITLEGQSNRTTEEPILQANIQSDRSTSQELYISLWESNSSLHQISVKPGYGTISGQCLAFTYFGPLCQYPSTYALPHCAYCLFNKTVTFIGGPRFLSILLVLVLFIGHKVTISDVSLAFICWGGLASSHAVVSRGSNSHSSQYLPSKGTSRNPFPGESFSLAKVSWIPDPQGGGGALGILRHCPGVRRMDIGVCHPSPPPLAISTLIRADVWPRVQLNGEFTLQSMFSFSSFHMGTPVEATDR